MIDGVSPSPKGAEPSPFIYATGYCQCHFVYAVGLLLIDGVIRKVLLQNGTAADTWRIKMFHLEVCARHIL